MRTTFLLVALCCSFLGKSQAEFSKWYFGLQAGLDFSTSPPTILTNGITNNTGGFASMCDNAGNLLMYTDGVGIANSTHTWMANGLGLLGTSSTQSGIIVKQPGNTNLYYVFTVPSTGDPATPTAYSIVDMNLAAGLGSVTVKNYTLYKPSCEKQVAVRHCNGKDVWIVSHEYYTNNFRAYLLTANGVNPVPVISAAGETVTLPGSAAGGELKVSPDGKKLAMATYSNSSPPATYQGGFFLFDFDASTGIVSNSIPLLSVMNSYGRPRGVEFSPDGKKLYGTSRTLTNPQNSALYQWDICLSTTAAIISSQYTYSANAIAFSSVQHAIDGKLYIAGLSQQGLSVINNPNAAGVSMNLVINGQSTAPKTCYNGLPNYINGYLKPAVSPFTNTVSCQTTNFTVPPIPTFSSGCQVSPYPPSGYLWNFGDPGSGAANSSTLTNPEHNYATLGTYTVSLILYNTCTNDTLTKVISISASNPTPVVTGNFQICKGEKNTYTVSGGSSYAWSNGATASTTTLAPTQTTVYTAYATLNGCTLSKTFTVNVNACTGLTGLEKNNLFRIFPNPVKDKLNFEANNTALGNIELSIYNTLGQLTITKNNIRLNEEIDLSFLNAGIYYLKLEAKEGQKVFKVIKE